MSHESKSEITIESFSEDAASQNLIEFWKVQLDLEGQKPKGNALPFVWNYKSIEPRLFEAAKLVDLHDTDRRALMLSNPGIPGKYHATDTMLAAYSLYNPGDHAKVHRHSPNASRFVLSGNGGYSTIEGEKCHMSRGDLIITPNGTWHDHGNDGKEPVIWVDVLDIPLVEKLGTSFFEFGYMEIDSQSNDGKETPMRVQSVREPDDHSENLYGAGGLVPLFQSHKRGLVKTSPMFVYRWEKTRTALERMRSYDGSPHDGIILEFTDPTTGGPVMSTMSFRAQMLRPGEHTASHQHASSTVYCAFEGSGHTIINGTKFEWNENDIFVVPGWMWHEHVNGSDKTDAILYSVTDEPVFRKLGLFREDRLTADGEVEVIYQ